MVSESTKFSMAESFGPVWGDRFLVLGRVFLIYAVAHERKEPKSPRGHLITVHLEKKGSTARRTMNTLLKYLLRVSQHSEHFKRMSVVFVLGTYKKYSRPLSGAYACQQMGAIRSCALMLTPY